MAEELGVMHHLTATDIPRLLTITHIKRDPRACAIHFDIWYFIPIENTVFPSKKEGEFDEARWFALGEARSILTDENNLLAMDFVEKHLFV